MQDLDELKHVFQFVYPGLRGFLLILSFSIYLEIAALSASCQ